MKSWKEVPHLFCNGKFKVKHGDQEIVTTISGIEGMSPYHNPVLSVNNGGYVEFNDCTLIARPISDMSSNEVWDIFGLTIPEFHIKLRNYGYLWSAEQFVDLLSIGVYPLEDTTDVIFKEK